MKYFNWTQHLKSNFETFKNSVIDEMTSFYGEKYRDIITERLNNTNFVFYGNTRLGTPLSSQTKAGKKSTVYSTKSIDSDINELLKKSVF